MCQRRYLIICFSKSLIYQQQKNNIPQRTGCYIRFIWAFLEKLKVLMESFWSFPKMEKCSKRTFSLQFFLHPILSWILLDNEYFNIFKYVAFGHFRSHDSILNFKIVKSFFSFFNQFMEVNISQMADFQWIDLTLICWFFILREILTPISKYGKDADGYTSN